MAVVIEVEEEELRDNGVAVRPCGSECDSSEDGSDWAVE